MLKYLLGFIVSIIVISNVNGETITWKLVKSEENISAYVCKLPDSPLKKVKVETTVNATLSQIVSIIRDADNHSDWVFLNEYSRVIEVVDNCNWKYYGYNKLPWPITDRDLVTMARLEQDSNGVVRIISEGIPDFIPEKEDYVRIREIHSSWTLTPEKNGLVNISFELEIDVGGKIPAWLINMSIARGPFNSMNSLKKIINEKRYYGVELAYINDSAID